MYTVGHKNVPTIFRRIWFTEDTEGIFGDKLEKERTGHLTEKKFGKQEAPTKDTRAAYQSTRVLKRT